MKKTIKKEEGKKDVKEEKEVIKKEKVEGKGAKKKVDLETKPPAKIDAKKKERTKSENDSKLKVAPNKTRSTSQSRWKTVNNNLAAKANKKVENTKEDNDEKDNNLKVRSTPNPKNRSISRNRLKSSPETKAQVEKPKLEITGTKIRKPSTQDPVSSKQKMDLLFAAYCNWGSEGEKEGGKGISAYQLSRWLKNVNLLRPKVSESII